MADVTIIARRPSVIATDTNAGTSNADTAPLIAITVDATLSEQHTLNNTVTDHPVEEGANISDHSRPEPEQLTLDCLITNTPFSTQQKQRGVSSGAYTPPAGQPDPNTAIGSMAGYAQHAYTQIKQLRDTGTLCTIATTLGNYYRMAITSISIPRDSKTFDALRFTITLKRVRIVTNKLTRTRKTKARHTQPKAKAGVQTPAPRKKTGAVRLFESGKDQQFSSGLSGFSKAALREE